MQVIMNNINFENPKFEHEIWNLFARICFGLDTVLNVISSLESISNVITTLELVFWVIFG